MIPNFRRHGHVPYYLTLQMCWLFLTHLVTGSYILHTCKISDRSNAKYVSVAVLKAKIWNLSGAPSIYRVDFHDIWFMKFLNQRVGEYKGHHLVVTSETILIVKWHVHRIYTQKGNKGMITKDPVSVHHKAHACWSHSDEFCSRFVSLYIIIAQHGYFPFEVQLW